MKKVLAFALVVGVCFPLPSTAQQKKLKSPEERFAALDKSGDNRLNKEEYLAQFTEQTKKEMAGQRFNRLDNDQDNLLSLYEFKAGLELQQNK